MVLRDIIDNLDDSPTLTRQSRTQDDLNYTFTLYITHHCCVLRELLWVFALHQQPTTWLRLRLTARQFVHDELADLQRLCPFPLTCTEPRIPLYNSTPYLHHFTDRQILIQRFSAYDGFTGRVAKALHDITLSTDHS